MGTPSMSRSTVRLRGVVLLGLLFRGRGNKDIADILHVGENTVRISLKRMFSKLGVADRTAAVGTALRHGIVLIE